MVRTNTQCGDNGQVVEMSVAMSLTIGVVGALIFCAMSGYVIRND